MSITFIKGNQGFTLLEALIGFLILSIGMLGIASLQAISLKAGKTSVYNSVALMKTEELLESMRVNPSAAALTMYQTASAGAGTDKSCSTNTCDEQELAQDDVFWWKKNLTAGLPGAATASVVLNATGAAAAAAKMTEVTVTVLWKERHTSDTGNTTGVDKFHTTTAFICNEIPC
jgi:type IV pilus assembly protein PilV